MCLARVIPGIQYVGFVGIVAYAVFDTTKVPDNSGGGLVGGGFEMVYSSEDRYALTVINLTGKVTRGIFEWIGKLHNFMTARNVWTAVTCIALTALSTNYGLPALRGLFKSPSMVISQKV